MKPESRAGAGFSYPLSSEVSVRTGPRRAKKWLWGLVIVPAGLPIYYVRELLASLLLFGLVFLLGSLFVLIILLAWQAVQGTTAWMRAARTGPRRLAEFYKFRTSWIGFNLKKKSRELGIGWRALRRQRESAKVGR